LELFTIWAVPAPIALKFWVAVAFVKDLSMMNNKAVKNKTALFQALEEEVRMSGIRRETVQAALLEAESELTPFFEDKDILRASLRAGALTYEHSFLSSKKTDLWVNDSIFVMLKEFRTARAVDSTKCFNCWADWRNNRPGHRKCCGNRGITRW
jgi:hypothetical protein